MLIKLTISFLVGILVTYLFFCLFLLSPMLSGGDSKAIATDVKGRWFWVMSIYIGKAVLGAIILAIVIGMPYLCIYGLN